MKFMNSVKFIIVCVLLSYSLTQAQIQITLPTSSGQPGTEAVLDVRVNDIGAYNVKGFQLKILYQANLIELLKADDQSGTICGGSTWPGTGAGYLNIIFGSSNPISGSGVLFKILVKYKQLGSTSITLDSEFSMFSDGNGKINFTVTNGTISVTNENKPPVFDAVPSKSVNENQDLNFTVNAIDPEGSSVVYTTSTLPQGASFTASTKTFSWKPTYQQAGNYSVTFYADDGNSKGSLQVSITVVDVNTAPKISTIGNKNINEGEALNFEIFATDDEGDNLTYQVTSTLPSGASFDAATHKFSWTPNFSQAGNYNVTFSVSDGKLTTTQTIAIAVANVNAPPAVTAVSDKTVNSGQTLTFDIIATDADNDVLYYSTANMPTGAVLDPATHKFSWKPTGSQAGDYTVIFMVSDGKATSTINVKIKVIKVNTAPVFTKTIANGTVIKVQIPSVMYEFQYEATDDDGDKLTFALTSSIPGAVMNSSGLFRWIPTSDQASKQYLILVSVSDGTFTESSISQVTTSPLVGIEDDELEIPSSIVLSQNYPNPFNPSTSIRFGLPKDSNIRLTIYNILGDEVAVLINKYMTAGYHTIQFNAGNLPSGLYFYKLENGNSIETRKMLLMK